MRGPTTDALRIAICVPDWQPLQQAMRGAPTDATYVIQAHIAAGLRTRGHRLTFVAPLNLAETVCTNDPQNPTPAPRTWSTRRWFDFASRNVWRVQQRLGVPYLNVFSNYRRFDACLRCLPGHDLVYERNALYNLAAAMACNRLRIPYVVFFEADQLMEFDFMGRPLTGLLRWRAEQVLRYNLSVAERIICVSEAGKAHLMTRRDVPAEKIDVFPNAVDVETFRPDPEARAQVRASLGLGRHPMIVFLGNFFHWHDVPTLLDAFLEVLATYPETRLFLLGDGTQRPPTMRRATDLGISHAVHFTGLLPYAEVPRFLSAADIAVAPYPATEQPLWFSPLKVFEYMASGVAIVASKAGQIAQVLEDNRNALLIPPGDGVAVAGALKRLIGDPTLRSRLGKEAREDALRNYSWERYLWRLETLFAAVATRRAMPHSVAIAPEVASRGRRHVGM